MRIDTTKIELPLILVERRELQRRLSSECQLERSARYSMCAAATALGGFLLLISVAACSSSDDQTMPPEVSKSPTSTELSATPTIEAIPTAKIFDSLGSMLQSRVNHSATLLQDGRVLVVGGMDEGFNPLRSTEVFEPETNLWSEAGEMREARTEHSATLLKDGRVMVTGGMNEKLQLIGSTEIFDPKTGKWSVHESMRTIRRGHFTLSLPDGRVAVVGGVGQTLGGLGILANIAAVGALLSTEIYDPNTDTWSRADDMLEGHSGGHAVVLKDGRVLIAGGHNQSEGLAASEIFDPSSNEWMRTSSMVRKTFANTASVLQDGTVLFTGGFGMSRSKGGITPGSEVFDPKTNEWRKAPDTVHGRMGHTNTLLPDGRVITIGGSTASGPVNSVEYMEPETWLWSEISPMSVERSQHTATLLNDGRILVAGGSIEKTAELYDPDADEWTSSGP